MSPQLPELPHPPHRHTADRRRPLRWLDPLLGACLAVAGVMALATALPTPALAAERVTGNGQAASEQRPLADFDTVQTQSLAVVVRQGASPGVQVQADSNLLPLLETVVDKGRLVVRWRPGSELRTTVKPVVTVTAVQPVTLVISGSGDIVGEALRVPTLAGRIEGSGALRLKDLAVDALTLEVRGSGDAQASGSAQRLAVRIAGSGDVNTSALRADEVQVRISGSGRVDVQAQGTLAVSIAGSGDVLYTGAATVKQAIAGRGSVTRRGP